MKQIRAVSLAFLWRGEIRMLRAMWRGLETESRTSLHGHEGGNSGH